MKSKGPISLVVLTLLLIGWSSNIDAHPYGAPESACATMIPNHGVPWQMNTCPYEIVLDKTAILSNESLTISLRVKSDVTSGETAFDGFKGYFVMAFDATGVDIEPVGTFSDPTTTDRKLVNCPSPTVGQKPKAGITHTSNDLKKSVDVVWTPPADYVGPIIIQASFVQERDIFWVRETSHHIDILSLKNDSTDNTTTTSTASSVTAPSTTSQTSTESPDGASQMSVIELTVMFSVAALSFLVSNRF